MSINNKLQIQRKEHNNMIINNNNYNKIMKIYIIVIKSAQKNIILPFKNFKNKKIKIKSINKINKKYKNK